MGTQQRILVWAKVSFRRLTRTQVICQFEWRRLNGSPKARLTIKIPSLSSRSSLTRAREKRWMCRFNRTYTVVQMHPRLPLARQGSASMPSMGNRHTISCRNYLRSIQLMLVQLSMSTDTAWSCITYSSKACHRSPKAQAGWVDQSREENCRLQHRHKLVWVVPCKPKLREIFKCLWLLPLWKVILLPLTRQ